jgi:hypothetical protein
VALARALQVKTSKLTERCPEKIPVNRSSRFPISDDSLSTCIGGIERGQVRETCSGSISLRKDQETEPYRSLSQSSPGRLPE